MSNTLLTPVMITREAQRILHQKLTFVGNVNRQYDDSFAVSGAKIGDTLKIRLPNRYTVRTGRAVNVQDTTETSVALQVATMKGVDMAFTSQDLTLSLDDFSKRIIDPAVSVLAANIEADALSMVNDIPYTVGTAGTTPNALLTYLQAGAILDGNLAPRDSNRTIHINPLAMATIVDSLKGLFQDSAAIRDQYREGLMGRTAGLDWYANSLMDQSTWQNGGDITVTVNGASQTGSSLAIGGVTNPTTFYRGQVFTIPGVYQVHAETRQATSRLQQFVVTSTTTIAGTTGTIPIYPAITTSGSFQTVSASPADTTALTFVGSASTSYGQSIAFHRDAFAFATADLEIPKGVDMAAREVSDSISMRLVRQYDINNDNMVTRLDCLYGYKTIRPELACRITN